MVTTFKTDTYTVTFDDSTTTATITREGRIDRIECFPKRATEVSETINQLYKQHGPHKTPVFKAVDEYLDTLFFD